jgi:hypothetical protein
MLDGRRSSFAPTQSEEGSQLGGRLYYVTVTQIVRWLLLPLLILFAAHALVQGGGSVDVVVKLGYAIGVLLLVFGPFLLIAGRATKRSIRFLHRPRGPRRRT